MRLLLRSRRLPLLALAALLAASGAAAQDTTTLSRVRQQQQPTQQQQPGRVTVPRVLGMSRDEASAALGRVGIKVAQVDSMESGGTPGTVVRQLPTAGSVVPAGTTATLVLARERVVREVAVPNVVGQPMVLASGVLLASGLRVEGVDSVESSARRGTVVTQEPAAGTRVPRRTGVRLTLAAAPQALTVPDLTGLTPERARTVLERSRLRLAGVDSVQREGGSGEVAGQRPQAGAQVRPGAGVSVTVTVPVPEPVLTTVPELAGLTPERARATLERARLRLAGVDSFTVDGGQGTVQRQQPRAGTRVEPGSGVSITLAVAVALVTVPNLSGLTPERARAALERARLRLAGVDSLEAEGAAGTVARQRPAAGAEVRPGSGVSVDVRVPPPPDEPDPPEEEPADSVPAQETNVTVPDVVGQTVAQARGTLAGASLGFDAGPAGADSLAQVASQTPAAGATVPAGTVVRLVLDLSEEAGGPVVVPPPPADGRDGTGPGPTPPPDDSPARPLLPWIALAVLLLLVGGALLARRVARGGRGAPAPVAAPPGAIQLPPILQVFPAWDPGAQSVAAAKVDGPLLVMPEVRLAVRNGEGDGNGTVSSDGPLVLQEEVSH
ncbi:MAG TPA: PASTA domain-containing protein, partial [Longimicrobiaceae bacterium]|nr:PASTA domain-containing protein [Longimicrobiaceae bacterium]